MTKSAISAEITEDNVLSVLQLAHKNSKTWLVEACINYITMNGFNEQNVLLGLEFAIQNDLPSLSSYLFVILWTMLGCHWYFENGKYNTDSMTICLSSQTKRTLWDFAIKNDLGLIKAFMDPKIFRKGWKNIPLIYFNRLFFKFNLHELMFNNQLNHLLPYKNKLADCFLLKARITINVSANNVNEFFKRAQPFKSLVIENTYHDSVDSEEIKAVKQGLRQMKSLKSLKLNEFPTHFFADCIQDLDSLESLVLKKYDGDFKTLLGIIQQNKPWKKIGIMSWYTKGPKLSPDEVAQILAALENNTTLTTLILDNQALDVLGAASLAEFIAKKPQLSVLDLRYNPLKAEGIKRLSFETNTTLREIRLTIDHQSELRAILDIIEQNKSLETLVLEIGVFQEEMWDELLQGLAKNNTLKNLEFTLNKNYLGNNSFPVEGKFLINLIEQVKSLISIKANFRLNSDDALRLAAALGQGKTKLNITDLSARQVLDHAKETLESRTPIAARAR